MILLMLYLNKLVERSIMIEMLFLEKSRFFYSTVKIEKQRFFIEKQNYLHILVNEKQIL